MKLNLTKTVLKILKAFNRTPKTLMELIVISFMHSLMTENLKDAWKPEEKEKCQKQKNATE